MRKIQLAVCGLFLVSGYAVAAPKADALKVESKGTCHEGSAQGTLVEGVATKDECAKKGKTFTWVEATAAKAKDAHKAASPAHK